MSQTKTEQNVEASQTVPVASAGPSAPRASIVTVRPVANGSIATQSKPGLDSSAANNPPKGQMAQRGPPGGRPSQGQRPGQQPTQQPQQPQQPRNALTSTYS